MLLKLIICWGRRSVVVRRGHVYAVGCPVLGDVIQSCEARRTKHRVQPHGQSSNRNSPSGTHVDDQRA
jgi:hypothetical protein